MMKKPAPMLAGSMLSFMALGMGICIAADGAQVATTKAPASQAQVATAAANAFLAALDGDQRQKVQFTFMPQKTATAAKFARTAPTGGADGGPQANPGQRPQGQPGDRPQGRGPGGAGMGPDSGFIGEQYGQAIWSNYPVSDVPRPGLQLGSLNATQRAAALNLIRSLLSAKGYEKVQQIMGSDQALHDAGQPFASGRDVYTIGVFGTPDASAPWMVQFGGHHLALNVVIAGARGTLTPMLTGAQPAIYMEKNGRTVRVLAGENDKAFALMDALDDAQRKQATLAYSVNDLVLGPGHDGQVIMPEGVKASALTAPQRALLLDLISEWTSIGTEAYARPRLEEIKAGLDDTYFAWSGPMTHAPGKNGLSYYRIQGPKLIIEFSPQGVGGDPTMHVHTIYRDPTNGYGSEFIQQ